MKGPLLRYGHSWGGCDHLHNGHGWCPYENRVMRNRLDTHSWQSAQWFSRFDSSEGPRHPRGHHEPRVARVHTETYLFTTAGCDHASHEQEAAGTEHPPSRHPTGALPGRGWTVGHAALDRLAVFTDTHPAVMAATVAEIDWELKVQYARVPRSATRASRVRPSHASRPHHAPAADPRRTSGGRLQELRPAEGCVTYRSPHHGLGVGAGVRGASCDEAGVLG